jgi:hypothetical protein
VDATALVVLKVAAQLVSPEAVFRIGGEVVGAPVGRMPTDIELAATFRRWLASRHPRFATGSSDQRKESAR